ncbi:MAG: dephospho-CoA kinase [Syntrophomonas sp.]|uniref:dephospho-CoA kinase n=1 Tax=Syntrophomonas sp. TaxID=2053627 RepID=UPI00262DF5A1|nr:dephospho-CoA kinase [Syntrophomonas sp.]MDD2509879.1 dephospho-CoA kinase [Syntrophomonas sp.]MDD3878576.1 dephospho-CoA kinase [Syntrophomonas sp.]MDD4626203.1 dephospho-CoA kinase [Syntrophomonas sp.]
MKTIGLTGGIASGKSVVARALQEMGAVLISADKIGHQVIEPGKAAYHNLIEAFGKGILNPDRRINRKKLGDIVFKDPQKLQLLNQLTHPPIMQEIKLKLAQIQQEQPAAIVVMEIPLLYETRMEKLFDQVWVVWVDRDTQIERLMARDAIDRSDAIRRIDSQMPLNEKARRADLLIDNRGSIEETVATTTRIFNNI